MNIKIVPIRSKYELEKFIMLPWKIYEGNQYWVPPLINDLKKTLLPLIIPETRNRKCELYLAFFNDEPVGRIFVSFNTALNLVKNERMGFFSMFECINNTEVARAIFDEVFTWFRKQDINLIRGPVSIDGADRDEYKGLLIDAFNKPPVLFNSYNHEYYIKLFEKCGFEKDYDVFAYYLEREKLFNKDYGKIIEYAKKRYNFRVDTLNLEDLEKDINDIKYILDLAVPDEWEDLISPSLDDIRKIADNLISFVDPDLIAIARTNNAMDRPIGFMVALPDYNQVLIHLNGRINPISLMKYIWYRNRISGARIFIMFVIPEYRKKGVSFAIYYNTFLKSLKKGYTWGEGSTIGEKNHGMRTDIESMGGQKYKTYRIFKKEI